MLQILLVDDENDALEALEWKLNNYIDNVQVTTCNSPLKAIDIINKSKPDVVFLDIQMPEMDGFTMIEKVKNRDFNLIFTTAHDEFALKAIKVSAIDYLLKPVDKDELLASMEKIKVAKKGDLLEDKLKLLLNNLSDNSNDKINISADGKVYLLDKDDVVMLKSDKSYTTIFLKNEQQILVSKTLKEVEKKFQFSEFFRVHNSYLINLNHIKEYLKGLGGELIMTNGLTASISRNRKAELFKKLYLD
ncbi:MAG: response regulator transcription factor [Lutibacter sp.]|uniref:LytR/AlgR family response regulator transcription factor n=1 Tax=Lutibacter sp. TaxID=1925666 RepID=UPI0017E17140|nr:LytTR family DNA-binding domain-containing protein [Lutibacter sp.]MBT8316646.1 LytTR family DNA-binding domain-containing protein [Lutibacter sp.]NNJ57506.1 response regulator transcription factor [Lutibacter sp.]